MEFEKLKDIIVDVMGCNPGDNPDLPTFPTRR